MLPLDRLRATVAGTAPIAAATSTFGIALVAVEPGRVTARLPAVPAPVVRGPGALLVLADHAMTSSVNSTITVADRQLTTLTLQFGELGPVPGPGVEVLADAHATTVGEDAVVSGIAFRLADGSPVARASGRCGTFTATPGWGRRRGPAGAVTGFADLHVTTAPDGQATTCVAAPAFANSGGAMHGGVLAAIAADALVACLDAAAPPLAGAPTDYEVTFLRGIPADSATITTTTVPVRNGQRFAVARAELHDATGRLAVLATASRWRG